MFPIKKIIVHHSGSKAKWYQLDRWWRSLNLKPYYHYLIDCDGRLIKGRQDFEKGRHIANMNTGSIGICFIGDYSENNPNIKMLYTFDNLCNMLINQYEGVIIEPHNKYCDTICPGPFITSYVKNQYGGL